MRVTQSQHKPASSGLRRGGAGFTLTELLIVIAIIAVLAGLIAAAAVNAMRKARESRISLEIKNISGKIEDFKTTYSQYPPNGMNPNPGVSTPGAPAMLVQKDFETMLKSAFPRHQEPKGLIAALCGNGSGSGPNLQNGMTAAEALYFWLGGFSTDELHPISGPKGPSFSVSSGSLGEVLEDRNKTSAYEFTLTQLGPRKDDGTFDDSTGQGRYITYNIDLNGNGNSNDPGEARRINFWRYTPSGSEQPLVYFDTSRYKPAQYDAWAVAPGSGPTIFAFKQLRSGVTATAANASPLRAVTFVNQGKFQVRHSGLDDDWGAESFQLMHIDSSTTSLNGVLLYPTGPFIGPIADNLANFIDGPISSVTEQ
jgi:prepilin-type N-terminal cleavage/methylation domain-containing protein